MAHAKRLSRVDEAKRQFWVRTNPVRRYREALGLSRATLALHLTISAAAIAAIESGLMRLTPSRADQFGELLGVPPEKLLAEYHEWRSLAPTNTLTATAQ